MQEILVQLNYNQDEPIRIHYFCKPEDDEN